MIGSRSASRFGLMILFFIMEFALVSCMGNTKPLNSEALFPTGWSHQKVTSRLNTAESSSETNQDDVRPLSLIKTTKPVRAIYVTSHVANSRRMKDLIALVDQSELNAMVLDINSEISLSSTVQSRSMDNPAHFAPSTKRSANHFRQVIRELKKHNIYLIARIVTFKNPSLANEMPDWALKRKNGNIWRDKNGTPWIDPFRQDAWEHPLALAEHAAQIGFDEIQFDYVRFPENAAKVDREVVYANDQGWTKSEAISRYLHRASMRAHKYGVRVSADVFGIVASSNDDMGIGQKWDAIVREIDVISPMIYPSHYSKGIWGIDNPDLNPGPIITRTLSDTEKHNKKLNQQGIATAKVRPWLQGFTAGWIHPHQKYGSALIREQIQVARKAGFNSYMLWNSANRYPDFNA